MSKESKDLDIDLSSVPEVTSRDNPDDENDSLMLPTIPADFVLYDGYLNYVAKPSSGRLVLSTEMMATIEKHGEVGDEAKAPLAVKAVSTEKALELMTHLITGKRQVKELDGVSHELETSVVCCRYCSREVDFEDGHYYRCSDCLREHCSKCHNDFQQGASSDVSDDKRQVFEKCSTAHSAAWQHREIKYVAPIGLRYKREDSFCDSCHENIDEEQNRYINVQKNKDCCMTCAVTEQGAALIQEYDLKLYDPVVHTTKSDVIELHGLPISRPDTLEEEDGFGSLMNWFAVYQITSCDEDGAIEMHHYILVNCNPESKLYNRVALASSDDVSQSEDWFSLGSKTLDELLTEIVTFSHPLEYIVRNAILQPFDDDDDDDDDDHHDDHDDHQSLDD
jgi:hypothetical protein